MQRKVIIWFFWNHSFVEAVYSSGIFHPTMSIQQDNAEPKDVQGTRAPHVMITAQILDETLFNCM